LKKIVHLSEYCIACGLCTVYCSAAHAAPGIDIVKVFKKYGRPPAGIRVEKGADKAWALSCKHCDSPDCVASCITGAMRKDAETGRVDCDVTKCVGCFTCVAACPYGMITVTSGACQEKAGAYKCDWCQGISEVPICVQNCPNEALLWVEAAEKQ
jgi:carbon-monoxide dehydrogenase iron sulfur subunit